MTLQQARALCREYFHVSDDAQADDILCAALRVERIASVSWIYPQGSVREMDNWWTEERLRACLASTRALFGHCFGVEVEE